MTRAPGDAKLFAVRLTRRSQEPLTIITVGGCGTANEVLNGLSFDNEITLGYIPTDPSSDLAKGLGLPGNPKRCLEKILSPKNYRWIDYGVLSYEKGEPQHRRFMVSSGIGLDAAVCCNLLENQAGRGFGVRLPKRLAYMLSGIRQLSSWVPPKGYLVLDGTRKIEFSHIYFISIHIYPYEGGGFRFAPKANGEDGLLELCVVHNSNRRGAVISTIKAFLGRGGYRRGLAIAAVRRRGFMWTLLYGCMWTERMLIVRRISMCGVLKKRLK